MSKPSSTHKSITMGKGSFGNSFDEAPLCCKGPTAQRVSLTAQFCDPGTHKTQGQSRKKGRTMK